MAKLPAKISLHIDLLKPQSSPEKVYLRFIRWLMSTGRFIVIIVEVIVLAAFLSRFKLDGDIQTAKEAAEQQIPYIKSLSSDETLVRQTQLQLATIKDIKQTSPDYVSILQAIAAQTPSSVKILSINLEKNTGKSNLKITGTAEGNFDVTTFASGLKSEAQFANINISGVSLEQGVINFTISGSVIVKAKGERLL